MGFIVIHLENSKKNIILASIFVYIDPISVSSFFPAVFLRIPTIPSGRDVVTYKQKKTPFWIFMALNKDVNRSKVSENLFQASCLLVQYLQY